MEGPHSNRINESRDTQSPTSFMISIRRWRRDLRTTSMMPLIKGRCELLEMPHIRTLENTSSQHSGEWKPYLQLHSVLVGLPGSERKTPKHFRFQRRIHQLLRDDQFLDRGCGVGARVFEYR